MGKPRYEIVQGDAGWQPWFGRFINGNGTEGWRTSETYTERRGVRRAIASHVRLLGAHLTKKGVETRWLDKVIEVRDVDERTP